MSLLLRGVGGIDAVGAVRAVRRVGAVGRVGRLPGALGALHGLGSLGLHGSGVLGRRCHGTGLFFDDLLLLGALVLEDRKSTRLNSSHVKISYAVFCLKKKTKNTTTRHTATRD